MSMPSRVTVALLTLSLGVVGNLPAQTSRIDPRSTMHITLPGRFAGDRARGGLG